MKVTAVIVGAGKGTRTGFSHNKLLKVLDGKTVIEKAVNVFDDCPAVDEIIVVVNETDYDEVSYILKGIKKPLKFVYGGKTRHESVNNALSVISDGIVVIHDGARPYVSRRIIEDCINSAKTFGSGVATVELTDTVAITDGDYIVSADRTNKLAVQTPQAFDVVKLKKAFSVADGEFTDESGLYAKFVEPVKAVKGDKSNVKLTYKEDFDSGILVGTGFDLHRLVEGRKLILGGIEIPHDKGLLGHSDADVLTHAIMDSVLSACHLRDIGYHFSDKDEKYKDISSMILLDKVLEMIDEKGFEVVNVSAVIMAEKPKLSTYIDELSTKIAQVIHISPENMGITCTTLEGIGTVGREEGIAVQAYSQVRKK